MDNQAGQRIKDLLSRSQKIVVAVGRNPSLDDMGAALALYLSLQSSGKATSIVSATEPLVEVSNLVGIDKVKTRYEGGEGADLVVSFPYKEGEIEKVSYTIENGYLNIVVKAGEQGLGFEERDVKYIRGGGEGGQFDALFVIGTPRLSDLQSIFDMNMLKDVTVVNIDNKQENQGFGDIVMVTPRLSSVSEQVAQLLQDLQIELDIDVAQNLMDGINFATDSFQSPRTSYLAFEIVGVLMRQGAIRTRIAAPRGEFQQRPPAPAMPANQQQQARNRQQQTQPQGNQQQQRPPSDRRPQSFDRRPPQQAQPQHNQQQQPRQHNQQPMSQPRPQQNAIPAMPTMTPMQPQQAPQPSQPPMPPQAPIVRDDQGSNPPSDWLTPKSTKVPQTCKREEVHFL